MRASWMVMLAGAMLMAALMGVLACGGGDDDDSGRVGDDDDSGTPDDDTDDDSGSDDDDLDDDADDDDADDDSGDDDEFGLTWIPITAGEFEMGCSPGDDLCEDSEIPRHTVLLTKNFDVLETEVTQQQFESVMGFNPALWPSCPNCPIEGMTWPEAVDFCAAVGGRLLTEAEWEYAARAGATTRYYCGDDISCLADIAWYSEEEGDVPRPQKVKQKEPNAWGLFDVLGNVKEYVQDEFDEDFYSDRPDPDVDPLAPGNPDGPVTRGGAFFVSYLDDTRLSSRTSNFADYRTGVVGFRCARDAVE